MIRRFLSIFHDRRGLRVALVKAYDRFKLRQSRGAHYTAYPKDIAYTIIGAVAWFKIVLPLEWYFQTLIVMIAVFIYYGGNWKVGDLDLDHDLLRYENSIGNEHNPELMEILERVKAIQKGIVKEKVKNVNRS